MLRQEQTCLLAGVAAVEGCGPDAAQDDVQHSLLVIRAQKV